MAARQLDQYTLLQRGYRCFQKPTCRDNFAPDVETFPIKVFCYCCLDIHATSRNALATTTSNRRTSLIDITLALANIVLHHNRVNDIYLYIIERTLSNGAHYQQCLSTTYTAATFRIVVTSLQLLPAPSICLCAKEAPAHSMSPFNASECSMLAIAKILECSAVTIRWEIFLGNK